MLPEQQLDNMTTNTYWHDVRNEYIDRIQRLESENAALKQRIARLEAVCDENDCAIYVTKFVKKCPWCRNYDSMQERCKFKGCYFEQADRFQWREKL